MDGTVRRVSSAEREERSEAAMSAGAKSKLAQRVSKLAQR